MEEKLEVFDVELNDPLFGERPNFFKKHLATLIVLLVGIIIIVTIIIIIASLQSGEPKENIPEEKKDEKKEDEKKEDEKKEDEQKEEEEEEDEQLENYIILKNDSDFIKPEIKLNAEFQLVKTKNNMIGLLISDPYSQISHVLLELENGYLTDTINGLAHFNEHMIFGGSEKYANYSIERTIRGLKGYNGGAYTATTYKVFFNTINYNYKFDEAIDILIDAFRYPLYDENVIKKEIQPVNSEFYARINSEQFLLEDIIRQLSSKKTSFNGMGCGNNETLKVNESSLLAKKLKGYHMLVNRPKNIFFVLYSNKTIDDLHNYTEKYFNYTMHKFTNDEIDVEDKKKLKNNIENLKKNDIFDENLYKHGFYYNSNLKLNLLTIFFNIHTIDYKRLGFNFGEYLYYLFNSKSLLTILKQNNYVSLIERIDLNNFLIIENNNIISIALVLSDEGLNNVDKVLLIIYKYIEIIKKEGFKKELFDNFVKYKKNQIINKFNKNLFNNLDISDYIVEIIKNYRIFGENQIFKYGTPSEENYDQNLFKEYLNNIKYENSFFALNIIPNCTEINTFLTSTEIVKLNYYNVNFKLGKFSDEFENKIKNQSLIIENLVIRDVNPYFSDKYEKVIPCYKEETNNCEELNEFDYEKENKYKGTSFEDNHYFLTYYQIDKSSESFIVKSYIDIEFKENQLLDDDIKYLFEVLYIDHKLLEINEVLDTIYMDYLDPSGYIGFIVNSFADNTEKIIKDFINIMMKDPLEEEFDYVKTSIKSIYIRNNAYSFQDYIFNLGKIFMNKGQNNNPNINQLIQQIENYSFNEFKNIHNQIFNQVYSVYFLITGNIDTNLVASLHNYFKEKIPIITEFLLKSENNNLKLGNSFVVNYYQKSTMLEEVDNGILVIYKYDDKYKDYMDILYGCLENIGMINLRFNYSNAYRPKFEIYNNNIYIYEQGKFKEIPQMEDDINEVLLGMLNGNVKCENYADIVNSYKLKSNGKIEKTPEYLYFKLLEEEVNLNKIELKETIFPDTFKEFMQEISPIFIEPKRYTILIVRNGISDEDFEKMFTERKNNAKYILNDKIQIIHTKDIAYLKNN